MKIFRCEQIRQIDDYTIRNEPVSSTGLMERAAGKLAEWFTSRFSASSPVVVFAGPGNNGGDGLALARMLSAANYSVKVYSAGDSSRCSADREANRLSLLKETNVPYIIIEDETHVPVIPGESIIVDALYGSGLTKPLSGISALVVKNINASGCTVVSVDIPSGLFCEDNSLNERSAIVRASYTLSFQFPKLAFMFPENDQFTGSWELLPIGLHREITDSLASPFRFTYISDVKPLLKQRGKFDHKGTYGHGLLVGGSYGRMGAIILGARAALHSGIGLLTCHIPSKGGLILQCSVPEAMAIHDRGGSYITGTCDTSKYTAAGIGPGMGTENETGSALHNFILSFRKPLVADADALNILSENKSWLKDLPPYSILTPHPKEFERLAGKTTNSYERLNLLMNFSSEYKCIVVLKGAHTAIAMPDGMVWFNSTGNSGMATAGSGDTLTGIILSLLAQGYKSGDAAITGVFIHGLAGDIALERSSAEALTATAIIDSLSHAFNRIRE